MTALRLTVRAGTKLKFKFRSFPQGRKLRCLLLVALPLRVFRIGSKLRCQWKRDFE
jgi:hypothetical protein